MWMQNSLQRLLPVMDSELAGHIQRSAKVFLLGCVTRLWALGQFTQPRKKTLADLCKVVNGYVST